MYQKRVVEARPPLTQQEKTWAAAAQGSALLTIVLGVATAGAAWFVLPIVPLAIYLHYRTRSEFVAAHALQGLVSSLMGSFGFLAFALGGILMVALVWTIILLLSVILIGIILIPVGILITVGYVFALPAYLIALIGISGRATIDAYNGRDYRYPVFGKHVKHWMAEGHTKLNNRMHE